VEEACFSEAILAVEGKVEDFSFGSKVGLEGELFWD